MKLLKRFKLSKKKKWMSFEELSERMHQRANLMDNSDTCKESTKNLIANNQDYFGVFKR